MKMVVESCEKFYFEGINLCFGNASDLGIVFIFVEEVLTVLSGHHECADE
jgi:hypothetical protein